MPLFAWIPGFFPSRAARLLAAVGGGSLGTTAHTAAFHAIQDAFAHADALRRHFDEFVVVDVFGFESQVILDVKC